jgi:hypothetical protein
MIVLTPELIEELAKTTNGFYSWDYVSQLASRVIELEEERRWIPVSDFIAKKGGVYYFEDLRGKLLLGYFQPKDKAHFQLEHYAKRIFSMPLPQPPESEGDKNGKE